MAYCFGGSPVADLLRSELQNTSFGAKGSLSAAAERAEARDIAKFTGTFLTINYHLKILFTGGNKTEYQVAT